MYHRNRVGGPTGPYAPSHDYLEEQVCFKIFLELYTWLERVKAR
jgi:hypothetical protein